MYALINDMVARPSDLSLVAYVPLHGLMRYYIIHGKGRPSQRT